YDAGNDHHRAASAVETRDQPGHQPHPRHERPSHLSSPFPQPPPPGVSMRRTSPEASRSVVFDGRRAPLRRLDPGAPSSPPAAPAGPCLRRSVSRVASMGASASNSLTTPSPPAHLPFPPLPRRSAYVRTLSGCSISRTSIGVFRVFDIPDRKSVV